METPMITAHSGCEGTPDNSLGSILKGIELGADCVEIDIRMDAGGALWLAHNASEDYASAVPLRAALDVIAESSVSVNCDLKEYPALYPTLKLAEACGIPAHRLIFSGSVDIPALLNDPAIAGRARIYINSEELCRHLAPALPAERIVHAEYITENAPAIAAFIRSAGIAALNAPYRYTDNTMLTAMHAEGVPLSLWTVNDAADQARLMNAGLINMTTRRPAAALLLRKQLFGK